MGSCSLFPEITHPKKRAFLAAYAEAGTLVRAAEIAQCEKRMHYHWLKDDAYKDAFARAKEMTADLHEDEASRRALGWDEPIYRDGEQIGSSRRYSDTMLIVRLKALRPEQYREVRDIRHSGGLTVTHTVAPSLQEALASAYEHRNGHGSTITG